MSLHGVDVGVGQTVRLTESFSASRMNSYFSTRYALDESMVFSITRVYRESLIIRGFVRDEEMSFQIDRSLLLLTDAEPGTNRKLGVKPEDTPEMTYIGIDDPRVQWIWDDLGAYADQQSWCPQYDTLAIRMGIPPRPKNHSVSITRNGIAFTTIVRARSQAEAEAKAVAALDSQTPSANG